jgi:hypothetical protein
LYENIPSGNTENNIGLMLLEIRNFKIVHGLILSY